MTKEEIEKEVKKRKNQMDRKSTYYANEYKKDEDEEATKAEMPFDDLKFIQKMEAEEKKGRRKAILKYTQMSDKSKPKDPRLNLDKRRK